MRSATNAFLEKHRIKTGPLATHKSDGWNGAFFIPRIAGNANLTFKVVCSDGAGWEHVSVSLPNRAPTWEEMCWLQNLFWSEDEVVVQFHPQRSEYVNNMRYCLHMWRPTHAEIPTPPQWTVGIQSLGTIG